jgi:hypothetical protein
MKALLQTERADVFFYAANGHGGWEAVIANLVAPGSTILVPGTGHFSDGWAEQVEAFGGRAVRTPYVEGLPIDPAAVEAALRDDREHRVAAVFVVQTDTASGTSCYLAALRRAIYAAAHPALFVVDVVARLPRRPSRWTRWRRRRHRRRRPDGPSRAGVRRRQRARDRGRARMNPTPPSGLAAPPERPVVPQVLAAARAWPGSRRRSA